ncbi:MAG TPA: lactate utilization protein [Methanoregulaceae archaeon]|nr:lactate utilization protein [Methanoregulaceae archaeon]
MATITPLSAVNLFREAGVSPEKWNLVPGDSTIAKTAMNIEKRGMKALQADNAINALELMKTIIPRGAEVMAGSSTTLNEIGFTDLLKGGESGWKSINALVTSENDERKRAELRRKSVCADYFVSSANAVAETGELVAWDASGSRTGAWPFAAGHLVIVAGVNKIVPTLDDALQRVREYCFPLENARAMHAYGTGSMMSKGVILAYETSLGRTTVILVHESLGF